MSLLYFEIVGATSFDPTPKAATVAAPLANCPRPETTPSTPPSLIPYATATAPPTPVHPVALPSLMALAAPSERRGMPSGVAPRRRVPRLSRNVPVTSPVTPTPFATAPPIGRATPAFGLGTFPAAVLASAMKLWTLVRSALLPAERFPMVWRIVAASDVTPPSAARTSQDCALLDRARAIASLSDTTTPMILRRS